MAPGVSCFKLSRGCVCKRCWVGLGRWYPREESSSYAAESSGVRKGSSGAPLRGLRPPPCWTQPGHSWVWEELGTMVLERALSHGSLGKPVSGAVSFPEHPHCRMDCPLSRLRPTTDISGNFQTCVLFLFKYFANFTSHVPLLQFSLLQQLVISKESDGRQTWKMPRGPGWTYRKAGVGIPRPAVGVSLCQGPSVH